VGFRARGLSETKQRAVRKLDYSAFSSRLCLFRLRLCFRETNHTRTKSRRPRRLQETKSLLVCACVGVMPLGMVFSGFVIGIFTSFWWTLQPGNIRSDPIRQNKSCSPVQRGLPYEKVGDASGPVSRDRRNSSLNTEMRVFS